MTFAPQPLFQLGIAEHSVWLTLLQEGADAFEQWQAYFSRFRIPPHELENIVRLLKLLLAAPTPPAATKVILSMVTAEIEERQRIDDDS